ncbi:MAG: nickel pincer cofactor biosynthesis protein LarC [Clostridiales bacterium]|nr:nickel pincer cofactor biosynthesis protein LarC [Clostridiales bacterium]
MKIMYIECNMGAAGDMLTAALAEAIGDVKSCETSLNSLGIPGIKYSLVPSVKCGITGTHADVSINGETEDEHIHEHHHEHEHEHGHHHHEEHHHHSSLHDIEHIINGLDVSDKVKADAIAVYMLIAEAESKAHGREITEIHFHEVGTMDAVADVVGFCSLMEKAAPDKVVVSPIHVGCGEVKCAHGTLPVPAPATVQILEGVPVYGGEVRGELCTPTGAALLKHFAAEFGSMPVMKIDKTGYGMGKKDFERANCVRIMIGETAGTDSDKVCELCCNVDDMTGEETGYATELLMKEGALDVFTTPVGMKKSRPGILITCLCRPEDKEKFAKLIFENTTTIGIRYCLKDRFVLNRREETVTTKYGDVRIKISEGFGVKKAKPGYEDISGLLERE